MIHTKVKTIKYDEHINLSHETYRTNNKDAVFLTQSVCVCVEQPTIIGNQIEVILLVNIDMVIHQKDSS